MSKFDVMYAELCKKILNEGVYCKNRTGINTYAISPHIMQFDLSEEFPILTTKKIGFKSAVWEMLWFYQVKSNDVRWLRERGVKIWNEWEVSHGALQAGKGGGQLPVFRALQAESLRLIPVLHFVSSAFLM